MGLVGRGVAQPALHLAVPGCHPHVAELQVIWRDTVSGTDEHGEDGADADGAKHGAIVANTGRDRVHAVTEEELAVLPAEELDVEGRLELLGQELQGLGEDRLYPRLGLGGMVWYGMVWCGMVGYGMLPWYGMVWYGMVWYGTRV